MHELLEWEAWEKGNVRHSAVKSNLKTEHSSMTSQNWGFKTRGGRGPKNEKYKHGAKWRTKIVFD